jgi:hypothetical protein
MTRSFEEEAITIRSRIGSGGNVVTSIMNLAFIEEIGDPAS